MACIQDPSCFNPTYFTFNLVCDACLPRTLGVSYDGTSKSYPPIKAIAQMSTKTSWIQLNYFEFLRTTANPQLLACQLLKLFDSYRGLASVTPPPPPIHVLPRNLERDLTCKLSLQIQLVKIRLHWSRVVLCPGGLCPFRETETQRKHPLEQLRYE